jgi:hypothetical protein
MSDAPYPFNSEAKVLMVRVHVFRKKSGASKPEAHVLMSRVQGDQQKSPPKSTCFEARSAS